jgi:Phage integrase family
MPSPPPACRRARSPTSGRSSARRSLRPSDGDSSRVTSPGSRSRDQPPSGRRATGRAGRSPRAPSRPARSKAPSRPPLARRVTRPRVFTTTDGTPMDGIAVTRRIKATLAPAGLPDQRFHDERHACASLLLAQGVASWVVMETLGHSQISLTFNTYAHVIPALGRDTADRMERCSGRLRSNAPRKGQRRGHGVARSTVGRPNRADSRSGNWSRHSDLNRGPAVYESRGRGRSRDGLAASWKTVAMIMRHCWRFWPHRRPGAAPSIA